MSDDGAVLVESGGFRVDRGRALDKIRAYRRGDVGCVWIFLRAAAAAGADDAAVRRLPDGLSIEFDGRPFAERDLRDPYAPLFEEGGASEAHRWLALGLIHAFGPGLRLVSVESGGKDARRRLSARDVGQEVVAEVAPEGTVTVVRLKTAGGPERHWRHPLTELDQAASPRCLAWGRTRVVVERGYDSFTSEELHAPGPEEWVWEEGPVAGRLCVPEGPREGVDLYLSGVYAGTVEAGGPVPVVGKVDDPGLTLDASLASLVRNERFTRLLESVRAHALGLARKVAAELEAARPELERLLAGNERLREYRRVCLYGETAAVARAAEGYLCGGGASPPGSRAEALRRVRAAARAEAWLKRTRTG